MNAALKTTNAKQNATTATAGRKSFDPSLPTNETIREFLLSYYGGGDSGSPSAALVVDLIFEYLELLGQSYRDAPTVMKSWPPSSVRKHVFYPMPFRMENRTFAKTVPGQT